MSKKHNNEVEKNMNVEQPVEEEEVVQEAAEEAVVEEVETAEENTTMNKPDVVEGEVIHDDEHRKHNHHKKHKHHHSSKKHHHRMNIDGKKVMKNVTDVTLNVAWIASSTIVICQCMTNPISAVSLILKEGIEYHYEREGNKKREEIIRNKVREEVRAEFENAAVVGPAA